MAGDEGAHASVALRAVPSIDTPFGPLSYPEPITVVHREFGDSAGL